MSELDVDPRAHGQDHAPGDAPQESAGHWVRNSNLGRGIIVGGHEAEPMELPHKGE